MQCMSHVMSISDFLLESSDAGGQDNQSATLCGRLHKHPFLIQILSTAATTEDQSPMSLFEFPASWPLSIVAKISDKLAVYLINSSWESSSSLESWQRSESDNMDCYFLKRKDCVCDWWTFIISDNQREMRLTDVGDVQSAQHSNLPSSSMRIYFFHIFMHIELLVLTGVERYFKMCYMRAC